MKNMYSCYLIDDHSYSIEILINHIEKIPNLSILGRNVNAVDAVKELNSPIKPDILFLDINMPQLSGLDVMDMISNDIAVIFTTSELQYALDAFDKDAHDFLLKPIAFEKFEKTVMKVLAKIDPQRNLPETKPDSIFINSGGKGKLVQLKFSDIVFIESINHYLHIQTSTAKYPTNLNINDILEELPGNKFIRMHKSFIVNIEKIIAINGSNVTLPDNYVIPIGELFKAEFMKHINIKKAKKHTLP